MEFDIGQHVHKFKPKICSFAYTLADGSPVVCQMGFAAYENKIILHTNTWTKKWQAIQNGQKIALCIGFTHLESYIQIRGTANKILITDSNFEKLAAIYFDEHTDAVNYKKDGQDGVLLIIPTIIRYAKVDRYQVSFNDYLFEETN